MYESTCRNPGTKIKLRGDPAPLLSYLPVQCVYHPSCIYLFMAKQSSSAAPNFGLSIAFEAQQLSSSQVGMKKGTCTQQNGDARAKASGIPHLDVGLHAGMQLERLQMTGRTNLQDSHATQCQCYNDYAVELILQKLWNYQ